MDVPLAVNPKRPAVVSGERPVAAPLFGCAEQDHVPILPHQLVCCACYVEEHLAVRHKIVVEVSTHSNTQVEIASDYQRRGLDLPRKP